MTRRITVPDDHVAVILPAATADELMTLMRGQRGKAQRRDDKSYITFAGDVMLALLEAKEA